MSNNSMTAANNLSIGETDLFRLFRLFLEQTPGEALALMQPGAPVKPRQDVENNELCNDKKPASESMSWADEVEEEERLSSVSSVEGVPTVSETVRRTVFFGGFGDLVDEGDVDEPFESVGDYGLSKGKKAVNSTVGTIKAESIRDSVSLERSKNQLKAADFVRTAQAKKLRALLSNEGIKMPKRASWHLALVTHTAGTMPDFFASGKDVLRMFANLGDSTLNAAVAAQCIGSKKSSAVLQQVRVNMFTDASLARRFASSSFAECIHVVSGVNLSNAKTGATALEAIIGLVAYYRQPIDVQKLMNVFNLKA